MNRQAARRVVLRCLVLVITITGLTLAGPTVAEADSGWKCGSASNHLMTGTVCIRTIRKDSSHISGVDMVISHSVYSLGPCLLMRFQHLIELGHGQITNGVWGDDGPFWSCPGQEHSYSWTHGGAGAWLGDGWNVLGQVEHYRDVYDMNPDAWSAAPRVWWPNH